MTNKVTEFINKIKDNPQGYIKLLLKHPFSRIDREKFLRKELRHKKIDDGKIALAIDHNPAYAGISLDIINEIADNCIKYETAKCTILAAACGAPGGWAMLATVPADIDQYYYHSLRIIQKLAYLYGFQENVNSFDDIDDETCLRILSFMAIMNGLSLSSDAINFLSQGYVRATIKNIKKTALTKTKWYPFIKEFAKVFDINITKVSLKGITEKGLPVLGAFINGGITAKVFYSQSNKLKEYLSKQNFADTNFYTSNISSTNFKNEVIKYKKNITPINELELETIPNKSGIYMVGLSDNVEQIKFLNKTTAKIKSKYNAEELEYKYMNGNKEILYIGKADESEKRGLKTRLSELLNFAVSKNINHSGGKDLWRIQNWQNNLVIYWCEINEPRNIEKQLLELHSRDYNSQKGKSYTYPFANWKK